MPFNSLTYFLFLPAVYLVFCLWPGRGRWCLLLAASLCFYAALQVPYLPAVLVLVALTSWGVGLALGKAQGSGARRALLWGGVATEVLILGALKYLPFLGENLNALAGLLSWQVPRLAWSGFVAIGVSYYVFQAVSYLFDVYLEIEEPEPHFGYFLLYLAFFPKLLQGPIERAGDLIPQLKSEYRFDYQNVRSGLLLFAWGLFKKVALADSLGPYADAVYDNVHAFSGLPLVLGTYAYAFQILLDFSGYTDMALGSALLFNVRLTPNFNSPYLATSVADFWRRWHITFSRWILDYIFKPLQMQWRNAKNLGTAAALLAAFLVSGIWHGASWGFVVWGGLHGLFMGCSVFYKPWQKKLHKALGVEKSAGLKIWQTLVTFNLVCFAWIFFRANSLGDALYVAGHLCAGNRGTLDFWRAQGEHTLIVTLTGISVFALFNFTVFRGGAFEALFRRSARCRYLVYNALVLAIVIFARYSAGKSFIYFQF